MPNSVDQAASTEPGSSVKVCEGTGYLPDQPFPLFSLHISNFGPVGSTTVFAQSERIQA